jgi:hypothetical protein
MELSEDGTFLNYTWGHLVLDADSTMIYARSVTEEINTTVRMRKRDRLAICGVVTLIALLAAGVWFIFQAQNISDLENDAAAVGTPRNLREVFRKALAGGYEVTISEAELNAYIAKHLALKQNGYLQGQVTLEKVLVRMEDNCAEIVTVRKIAGRPFTTSMWIQIEQTENASGEVSTNIEPSRGPMPILHKIKQGGRFGQLIVPQGFMLLTEKAHTQLAAVFPDEIHDGIQEMARIRIRKGALDLHPSYDGTMSFK